MVCLQIQFSLYHALAGKHIPENPAFLHLLTRALFVETQYILDS